MKELSMKKKELRLPKHARIHIRRLKQAGKHEEASRFRENELGKLEGRVEKLEKGKWAHYEPRAGGVASQPNKENHID